MNGVKIDARALEIIEQILREGNDVIIRRKRDGVVILEDRKKIKYDTCEIGRGAGQ